MNWNYCRPTVLVTKKVMTTFDPYDLEARFAECRYELLTSEAG